ncbi:hypothetical protein OYC64_011622 [Pagothenia borchgrevinki]|uniref:Doublecortin domain-containing protein n=1 Tax=Pagothenia borchgrevinki TaxID=8213 RepID=A0ABD2FGW6_PAGBO
MSEMGFPRVPPEQSSGSGHSFGTPRHARVIDPILSKRVCFYKSGDPQFNGLRMVINNRTFKTFDALLDSLSKKVPLPFGVRNITTPRGVHAVHTLDELEDGKSYICSDNRKVKPINLALARKKPPPWYNARPVSSRRRTVQRARSFPGKNLHKHEQVFMRTPKKLLVFRNGDPAVKHTVVLHKRTTPSFESILDYISELVQYQVAKLHTADGRRVDGLPGLILCSGTVVAVGREPFRHANYNEQKSPGPTMLPTKRVGPRRLRALKRKKKSLSYTSKSRNFSSSSEKYIVNRIHNSIAGSSYDLPSHSLELESSRTLESVPETPEGHGSVLPSEDDIEKSFRVNQDGSMTVEMKVRLTIKEEETIHWTTTLSRSAVANQLNETCLPELDAEQEISSAKSNSQELQSTAASTNTINKDKPHDNNDDNPPSLCNGAFGESGLEEDDTKVHREVVSPRSTSTPERKQMRKKQASLESIKLLMAEGIQEDMVGSYSYREQMETGAMTEQYCMVKQSSSRPVPKPRIISSFDGNSRNVSTFKSAGLMSEILQIESNEEESLDVASPSVRHKSSENVLSRNLSSDSASEPTDNTLKQTTHHRNHLSTSEMDKTLTCDKRKPLEADQTDDNKGTNDITTSDEEKSITQIMSPPLNMANQPNMKPVLEKICYSIKSIRQITQNNRRSCLEKSNSLPDFSSHVASTFGSSTKALLAFLSVMTLKEGMANLDMVELNANNVSCAEALKMIDSLREIASIEDSNELQVSLSNLQQSASKQLLQSWQGFQELKCKSRSETPIYSEDEHATQAGPEKDCGIDENVIDEIVDTLGIPDKLKEELDSLSIIVKRDNEEEIEVEPKDNIKAKISQFSTGDGVDVRTVAQDEKVKVDVGSIIRKFTDITQPKQSNTVSITKETKENASQYGQDGAAPCPPTEPNDKEIPNERQPSVLVKDNWEQGHKEDKSNQERDQTNEVVSDKQSFEEDSCTFELEEQDKINQMMMYSEESIPENELSHDDESGSDEEGQRMSSAIKDLEVTVSCKQSASSSESAEQHSSEEEPDVECEEILNENLNPESHSEEEEEEEEEEEVLKQPSPDYGVEVRGDKIISSPDSQHKSISEGEESEIGCQAGSIGPNVSFDESTCKSDVDDSCSEEEQQEVECKKLQVIIEENVSGNEAEEEEYLGDLPVQREIKDLIEETEEDEVSSDDEDQHETQICDEISLRNLIENQDSYAKSSLINSHNLTKSYGFNADEDSGNDHSSCEEHPEVDQPKVDDGQINCLNKSLLSFDVKEEKEANMDRYIEKICTEYKEAPELTTKLTSEKAVDKLKHQFEELISQSVTERRILLEKKVADEQKTTERSAIKRSSQKHGHLESDMENSPSESPASQTTPINRSPPQSSLSFSYDSSGVITSEPESNKVRLIREMFLAKNSTDIQHGRFPSLKTSDLSDIRAETSASAGYQSLTSSDLSSGEDDSARKSITKGFVRRTIERLYGKKEAKPDEEVIERPPSATKEKMKEHPSIFSPFHIAKAMSELSYFNSSSAVDTLSEAAHCITFHAQVRPEDAIDHEQWLFKENTLMRKSISDPVGINKNVLQGQGMCEDTEENTSHSLINTQSEVEDKKSTFTRKCTYFSLPHASDSEPCQEDLSIVSKNSAHGDCIIETRGSLEDTKMWAERNGTLPGVGVTDFKKKDNKVHPLVEPSPDAEVVVLQPGKGQGVRRVEDPDMLDVLYNFCGQNCPFL